jgi:SNF2 family DNA or RNA helicase
MVLINRPWSKTELHKPIPTDDNANFKSEVIKDRDCFVYTPDILPGKEIQQAGGRWDAKRRAWILPPIMASIEIVLRLHPGKVRLTTYLYRMWSAKNGFFLYSSEVVQKKLPDIWDKLYSYQQEAVTYLYSSPHSGAMLQLAPRLGKTITTCAAARAVKAQRVLVVTLLSLVPDWKHEIKQWTGQDAAVAYRSGDVSARGWIVTNYETVRDCLPEFLAGRWDLVVCDESILLQNRDAERTEAIQALRDRATRIWLLSGSPVSKHADGLYAQLRIISPKSFTSYWRFARTYCHTQETPWGTKVTGTRLDINIAREFRDLIFTRHYSDIEAELPEIVYQTVHVALAPTQQQAYQKILDEFLLELESGEEMPVVNKVAQLVRLQQCVSNPANFGGVSASGKLDVLMALFEHDEIPLPAVIWTQWTEGADQVYKCIARETSLRVGISNGKVKNKRDPIDQFKQNQLDILVLSLGVGKYGLTLANAQAAVYYDKSWDADAYIQSMARIYLPGQKTKPLVLTLHAQGTVDELVEQNLRDKSFSIGHTSNADLAHILRSLQ